MEKELTKTDQSQDIADNDTKDDGNDVVEDGIVIDAGEADPMDDANEGDQDSDDANEGDQDSDEDEDEDKDKDKDDKSKEDKAAYAFKKKSAQLRQEKEKRETLERELAATTQKLAELTAPKRPVIPPMPDTYDPQYDQKIAARDEVIRMAERYDQQIANAEEQVRLKAESAQVSRQEHVRTLSEAFNVKAETLGLKPGQFKKAEKAVADALGSKGGAVAEFLLSHEQGPAIVNYLGNDDLALDKVSSMAPIDAAVYIATVVTPKLGDLSSSKKSKTPPAPKVLKGRGKVKSTNPMLKGATFE